ncbi:MAG: DUF4293 domain-containing protein [Bacteroidia bacterium]|nr:DUF4293 domain-containing protein [Bacteroidia bacterium]MBT8230905.1 DUF4293 domain-containing protein [Bacteroidia bacterium]NNK90465.1 DUF4293 domain-containing protein [Saprospiraceae bacterium]
MIQRIQTVFLFLATLCFGGLFLAPFALSDKEIQPFFEDRLFNIQDHIVLLILTIIGGMVALISIFMYRNRPLQMRLGFLGIISSLFLALVASWLVYSNAQEISDVVIEDQIGLYLPVAALLFFILSNRFIKKDEKTVQSMDRLR